MEIFLIILLIFWVIYNMLWRFTGPQWRIKHEEESFYIQKKYIVWGLLHAKWVYTDHTITPNQISDVDDWFFLMLGRGYYRKSYETLLQAEIALEVRRNKYGDSKNLVETYNIQPNHSVGDFDKPKKSSNSNSEEKLELDPLSDEYLLREIGRARIKGDATKEAELIEQFHNFELNTDNNGDNKQ